MTQLELVQVKVERANAALGVLRLHGRLAGGLGSGSDPTRRHQVTAARPAQANQVGCAHFRAKPPPAQTAIVKPRLAVASGLICRDVNVGAAATQL